MKKIAVVSGANRGIGLEISKQLAARGVHVVLTSRDETAGCAARDRLVREGLDVECWPLDVTREDSIAGLADHLRNAHGGLDILVDNAGVALKGFDAQVAEATLDVNFFGALHLTDRLLPLLRRGGRVVMMTSELGKRSLLGDALREEFAHPE